MGQTFSDHLKIEQRQIDQILILYFAYLSFQFIVVLHSPLHTMALIAHIVHTVAEVKFDAVI